MPYQTETLVREALARPFAERRHIFANQIVVGECIAIGRGGLTLAVPPKSSDKVRSPASFSVVTKPLSRGDCKFAAMPSSSEAESPSPEQAPAVRELRPTSCAPSGWPR